MRRCLILVLCAAWQTSICEVWKGEYFENVRRMMIRNTDELLAQISKGTPIDYVFFWGHRPPKSGVSKSCFSQWYEAPFEADGIVYPTAEHYMMAGKAKLFHDGETLAKILTAKTASEAKKLGRLVKGFDDDIWQKHRFDIVVSANLAKFGYFPELKAFLMSTSRRVLVEASPTDRIWGIGLAANDSKSTDPSQWKGLNLLGFAVMEVRQQLRGESSLTFDSVE